MISGWFRAAKFLKYIWLFFNIMHEMIKSTKWRIPRVVTTSGTFAIFYFINASLIFLKSFSINFISKYFKRLCILVHFTPPEKKRDENGKKWKLTRNGSRKTNKKFTDFEEPKKKQTKTKKQKRFSLIKEIIRNKKLPHF